MSAAVGRSKPSKPAKTRARWSERQGALPMQNPWLSTTEIIRDAMVSFMPNYGVSVRPPPANGGLRLHESNTGALCGLGFVVGGLLTLIWIATYFFLIDPNPNRHSRDGLAILIAAVPVGLGIIVPCLLAVARVDLPFLGQGRTATVDSFGNMEITETFLARSNRSDHKVQSCFLSANEAVVDPSIRWNSVHQHVIMLNTPTGSWRLCNFSEPDRALRWLERTGLERTFGACRPGKPVRLTLA